MVPLGLLPEELHDITQALCDFLFQVLVFHMKFGHRNHQGILEVLGMGKPETNEVQRKMEEGGEKRTTNLLKGNAIVHQVFGVGNSSDTV